MISTRNLSHFESVENRSRFTKPEDYLDFDTFLVKEGVIQVGVFFKQMEYDMIYQLPLTR